MARIRGPFVVAAQDPASIGAVAVGNLDLAVVGARLGSDMAIVVPPPALVAGLVVQSAFVQAADVVRVRLNNASAGALDAASQDWTVLLVGEEGS